MRPVVPKICQNIMRIQLFVPQEAAVGVKPGVTAIVRVAEIPGHPFPGQVTPIADALDPGTRTLLTEIDVPNRDGEFSPGMYSTVELQIPRKTPSLRTRRSCSMPRASTCS
jgi:multidrug efflux pump subunit AcrA (membrane-fusion protein)